MHNKNHNETPAALRTALACWEERAELARRFGDHAQAKRSEERAQELREQLAQAGDRLTEAGGLGWGDDDFRGRRDRD
jgi:hypothetical protein